MLPFQPFMYSVVQTIAVGTTPQTITLASCQPPDGLVGPLQVCVSCVGSEQVYMAWNGDAQVPSTGQGNSIPVPLGASSIFSFPANGELSFVAGATGTNVSISIGSGA